MADHIKTSCHTEPFPDPSREGRGEVRRILPEEITYKDNPFSLFGAHGLGTMFLRIQKRQPITGETLARTLEANPETVSCDVLRLHLRRVLTGEVKRPDGQPSAARRLRQEQRRAWALADYEQALGSGEPVYAEEIAELIEANPHTVTPTVLREYLCAFLRGQVKNKRGRKAHASDPRLSITKISAGLDYARTCAWLRTRKKRHGLRGWSCVREAPWWKGRAPHQIAAEMVRRRGLRRLATPESVLNLISAGKTGRN